MSLSPHSPTRCVGNITHMGSYDLDAFAGLPSFFLGISPGFGQKLSDLIAVQYGIFKESVVPDMCGGASCQVFILVWNLER